MVSGYVKISRAFVVVFYEETCTSSVLLFLIFVIYGILLLLLLLLLLLRINPDILSSMELTAHWRECICCV
jgi:hypothetical protein